MHNQLQETIQNLLNTYVAEGLQHGAQVAVYIDGELVVDAWAGIADIRTGSRVDGDTLFPVFSTTKGVFSTVIHILAERGKIDYDAPVAKYWPEFAANGKEAITVRHVLAHTSAIPYMPEDLSLEQVSDWDFMAAAMAQLKPAWLVGSKQFYHSLTWGWILGEVARRVDGRTVSQLVAEEICRPLGVTRMYCGVPAELEPTVAFLEMVPNPPIPATPPPHDVALCMMPLHEWMNRSLSRRTPQPACSGTMAARSVARHYAALLPGGVDGIELLPPARVRLATEEQVPTGGYEETSGRRGLGYLLGFKTIEMNSSPTAFGHGGWGGSMAFADPKYRIASCVTRNRFSDHHFAPIVAQEIYKALGV